MDKLSIDWEQERPTSSELSKIWNSIKFSQLENWTLSTDILKEKIFETHVNGGIQIHKYKVLCNAHFEWFAQRNRLDEIDFLQNLLKHKDFKDYRIDLQMKDDNLKIKKAEYFTDMYDLPARLSRIMAYGGAYENIDYTQAWQVATDFIKEEFDNRFIEFNLYDFVIESAHWFQNFIWDTSILLFDKRKYEIIIIDITDTD